MNTEAYTDELINPKVTLVPTGNGNYAIQASTAPGYISGTSLTEAAVRELQAKGIMCLINEGTFPSGKQVLLG